MSRPEEFNKMTHITLHCQYWICRLVHWLLDYSIFDKLTQDPSTRSWTYTQSSTSGPTTEQPEVNVKSTPQSSTPAVVTPQLLDLVLRRQSTIPLLNPDVHWCPTEDPLPLSGSASRSTTKWWTTSRHHDSFNQIISTFFPVTSKSVSQFFHIGAYTLHVSLKIDLCFFFFS